MSTVQFAIIGKRPNGEVLHYVSNHTQGERFVPSAYFITDSDVAEVVIDRIAPKYVGLSLSLERRLTPVCMG